jgi:hypothetical protein
MSTNTLLDKRIWVPAAAAGLVLLGIGLVLFPFSRDEPASPQPVEPRRPPADSPADRPRTQTIDQADWKVTLTRAGAGGRLPKRARERLQAQRPRLRSVVRSASDAMFLEGGKAASSYFYGPAHGAFRRSGAGVPRGASGVRTLRRTARIAIQGTTARRAAAAITMVARGSVKGRDFRLHHRSQLWLERTKKGWKVIAFDIEQRPMPLGKNRSKPKKEEDK